MAASIAIAIEPPTHVALVDVSDTAAHMRGILAVDASDMPTGMCMCLHRVPVNTGVGAQGCDGPDADAAEVRVDGSAVAADTEEPPTRDDYAARGPEGQPLAPPRQTANDTEIIFAGYEDGSLLRWSVTGGEEAGGVVAGRESVFSEPLLAIACNRKGTLGVCGGAVDELAVFVVDEGRLAVTKRHNIANRGINSLCLRDDEKLMASGGWDGRIRLFSWPKFTPLAILSAHRDGVATVRFSGPLPVLDGGQLLAAASKDQRISLWSLYN